MIVKLSTFYDTADQSIIQQINFLFQPIRITHQQSHTPTTCSIMSTQNFAITRSPLGQVCLLYKLDLQRAYRQIPIDTKDYHLLGFRFNNLLYFDTRCPFGLKTSAVICQRTTKVDVHCFTQLGFLVDIYLDDFYGADSPARASTAFTSLRQLLQELGLQTSPDKDSPPSTKLVCLGINVNSEEMSLSVPTFRVQELLQELSLWSQRSHYTKKQLQSLLGKLSFVTACVKPGRIFMARSLQGLQWLDSFSDRLIRLAHAASTHSNMQSHVLPPDGIRPIYCQLALRGSKRLLGTTPFRKLPISPNLLLSMARLFNLGNPLHAAMWALFLVAFFSFLRKSKLVAASPSATSDKLPRRCDFVFAPEGAFCRYAPLKLFNLNSIANLFLLIVSVGEARPSPFECNVPAELIKFQGDWRTDAYLVYLEMSSSQKRLAVNSMASRIWQLTI
ncbi:hypothetical protein P5673_030846 [Acropora cervicornis]|uniref:Reverse transcriptase domain-containing protein n=1 Tax=Acropora cervicornis TaxID=6130 RepID=A0AAD9PTZ2_ACRCE|nr:hypothetical protein P5673_030846 [Acropora cervicornis]